MTSLRSWPISSVGERIRRVRPSRFVVVVLALSGCTFDKSGLGELTPVDSAAVDSGFEAFPDSAMPETAPPIDSSVVDSADADAEPDVPETPPPPPILDVVVTAVPPSEWSRDLSAEGAEGWAHWALTDATSFNRKVAALSVFDTLVASPGAIRWADYNMGFTWADGTPSSSAMNTRTGLLHSAVDSYFQVDTLAGLKTRTLRLYISSFSEATLIASLTDKAISDAIVPWPPVASLTGANVQCVAEIKYRATNDAAKLRVLLLKKSPAFSMSLHAGSVR